MESFLKDVDDKMLRGGAMARNLVSEVRAVAYEVEDIIDKAEILRRQSNPRISIRGAISKYACFPIYLTHLHRLGARIDSANAWMKTIFEDHENLRTAASAIAEPSGDITPGDISPQRQLIHPDFDENVDVIGFDDQVDKIKNDLLDGENINLTIVSIVGLGGAGKSTMAMKVYCLDAVKEHFDVHNWILVSHRFVLRDLLKEMAKRFIPFGILEATVASQQPDDLEEHGLKKLLHNFLQRKRYLIVLDDVWSRDDWDKITSIFPDAKNGSRVVLTTRNEVVAKHPFNARIHKLKLLNEEASKELLLRTAVPWYNIDGSSSSHAAVVQNYDDLKELGSLENMKELVKELAVKCCGLPLAIVGLGGYLLRNLHVAQWKRLRSSVHWHNLIKNERIISAIMDPTHYDMPSHLRSCFMYITAFPQDSCIHVQTLTNLWTAEGFIPLVRGEEEAVKCIDELVRRCIIQVEQRATSGRVVTIKVQDILRHCGIERARKEGFIKDCCTMDDMETAYSEETVEFYRVVLHGFLAQEIGIYNRKLRTILAFHLSGVQIGKSFQGFRHLRVLYLQCLDEEVFLPREIDQMRYLRYLGFGGTSTYHLPTSIGNLLSLETMDAIGGRIYHIPGSIWKIPALKRLHIVCARGWSVPRVSLQSKMQVMVFSSAADLHSQLAPNNIILEAKRIMDATIQQLSKKKNPNLSCIFGMTCNTDEAGSHMNIVGRRKEGLQLTNDLPDFEDMNHITVLKLRCANLLNTDQKMLEIGRMTFLKVLEIGEQSYTGSVLTCPSGSFSSLVQLVLYDLALEHWKMEVQSMIRLREVTLCKCPNLLYLPDGFLRLPHLCKLHLIAMPRACYERDTVRELKTMRCLVFESVDERDFKHLDLP
ncbi:hypothetical protein QOZ80_5BG0441720 [Eleusine coracana subsp. coracana]|nr:hypothetical protein QOZ80_5BG0441720 [Eleusine coracana subsp. coracana]